VSDASILTKKPMNLLATTFNMSDMNNELTKLLLCSKTATTWSKHRAGWNMYNLFKSEFCPNCPWPLSVEYARSFVVWALNKRMLSASTVKSYLSSIRLAHYLENFQCENFSSDPIIKMCLSGAVTAKLLNDPNVSIRPAMDINVLLMLGHRISGLGWSVHSQQVVWGACLLSFFTSCRMGEIVSPHKTHFDPKTTLLWKHVRFASPENISIFVPYSKCTGLQGKTLEIFELEISSCCPVSALVNLRMDAKKAGVYEDNKPVFTFGSGKFLTTARLNTLLKYLLADLNPEGKNPFSCHSFRSAIPTLISTHPDRASVKDIAEWGGWTSDSYQLYAKLEKGRKKFLFAKIASMLYNDI
jgi:hypothetical protein